MIISIIILTHNAPKYIFKTLYSLNKKTDNLEYEVIVVDNSSGLLTRIFLLFFKKIGYINKIAFLSENTLFAKGNNIGFKLSSESSSHILLLNSDIKIINRDWLKKLINYHKKGVTSYGVIEQDPVRVDGYCFLIDKELYDKYGLDESFEWWWSITKLQSQILKEQGCSIIGIKNHDRYIIHYGGISKNKMIINVKGMNIKHIEVVSWFKNEEIQIIDLNNSAD